jgi:uncharacterized SAM-binding protein YcdF (DUF218 family)
MAQSDAVQRVWDYHQVRHELSPADAVMVLGSHDLRVGERAAELFLQNLAPVLILSGGYGNFTRDTFKAPEADLLAEVAERCGVPREAMIVENRSTNTGENVLFVKELLKARGLSIKTAIAVHKPYMERRTYGTLRKQWPELQVRVTSPKMSFDDYCDGLGKERVINIMVGDLHRIFVYPSLGFMEQQEIPPDVIAAFKTLVAAGYTQHLLKDHDPLKVGA